DLFPTRHVPFTPNRDTQARHDRWLARRHPPRQPLPTRKGSLPSVHRSVRTCSPPIPKPNQRPHEHTLTSAQDYSVPSPTVLTSYVTCMAYKISSRSRS